MTRAWIREDNRQGVRILSCLLPKKSPWLNPIEPMWIHDKRLVFEPERVLAPQKIVERVCVTFGNRVEALLNVSNYVL